MSLDPSPITEPRFQAGNPGGAPDGTLPGARIGDMYADNFFTANGVGAIWSFLCSPGGNPDTVSARGRCYPTGARIYPKGAGTTLTTVGATSGGLFSFDFSVSGINGGPMGSGTYTFFGDVIAVDATHLASGWARPSFTVRWQAGALAIVAGGTGGAPYAGDAAISAATVAGAVSGTSARINVLGVTAVTIAWSASIGFYFNAQ